MTPSPTKNTKRANPSTRSSAWRCGAIALAAALLLVADPALASGKLSLVPDAKILVPLLIVFVLLIAPLNKLIFQPLFGVLDERRDRIEGARERAQRLEADAESSISRYRGSVRDAREEAENARQSELGGARSEQGAITGEAKAEAASEIERARGEIAASLEEARTALRESSEDLARVAAERILGRSL